MPGDRVLYFDCFAGAGGDMIVASLLDLGLELERLKGELSKLPLEGYALEAKKVIKSGFSATGFEVVTDGREHVHCHKERKLNDILFILEESRLAPEIKEKSIAIFRRLAAAEAGIHGKPAEEVHFHEVGAIDAIIDVVGAVAGIHQLEVDRIIVSPLPMGRGFVQCSHGTLPVPAPAVVELLAGKPVYGSEHNGETVTPTGAAILSTLASAWGKMPPMTIQKVGYGAGTRDFEVPNLIRAFLGTGVDPEEAGLHERFSDPVETVIELQANIDDMNPEFYDHILDTLFAKGALDVFLTPVYMKKNRPGVLLTALCTDYGKDELLKTIFLETSTIGVRVIRKERYCLPRQIVSVVTEFGEVRVKEALLNGRVANRAPEYSDCKMIAAETGVPVREIYNAALRAAIDNQSGKEGDENNGC
ncbi:MAG: TIGR00299 family protein [Firmicutes bacterium HGW-Firmicutes-14]|nr:MAG: TIGR00299 family protein [Firmicutes bacterium HGW-Firmicutes-14]